MSAEATELHEPPGLGLSFARALASPLPLIGGGGKEAPDTRLALSEVSIDRDELADYNRVCGFRLGDVLPPTYLHVLAFPLALRLMTERAFPFPVIGLVHIENRIVHHRPVAADEQVALEVHAERLRPHEKGRQIDLVSRATVDGETVWEGISTYLRRGGGADGSGGRAGSWEGEASEGEAPAAPGDRPAAEAHPAGNIRVPDDIGRRYAAVAGDRNPIHLHSLSAKLFGFPRAIAHGMWLKARTLAGLEGRLPERFDVEVEFKKPLLLPATVELRTGHDERGWTVGVYDAKKGSPHLTGTVTG
jgi:acyl dehydratase